MPGRHRPTTNAGEVNKKKIHRLSRQEGAANAGAQPRKQTGTSSVPAVPADARKVSHRFVHRSVEPIFRQLADSWRQLPQLG